MSAVLFNCEIFSEKSVFSAAGAASVDGGVIVSAAAPQSGQNFVFSSIFAPHFVQSFIIFYLLKSVLVFYQVKTISPFLTSIFGNEYF